MNDFVLALRQVRYQNRSFWRNPTVAFFTFLLPLIFLVILNALLGNNIRQLPGGQAELAYFYVPSMVALSIINACYTSLVMTISIARDDGVLKRVRGTPLRSEERRVGKEGGRVWSQSYSMRYTC